MEPKSVDEKVVQKEDAAASGIWDNELAVEFIPAFHVGDVVSTVIEPDRSYVIKESILDHDDQKCIYEVSPISNIDGDTIRFTEDALEFQYHDAEWESYFTEGRRQRTLPAWRGELYNFYSCYTDINTHGALDPATLRDYKNSTLPPMRMKHILRSHSIYDRIYDVIHNDGNPRKDDNRDAISERLKIDDLNVDAIADSIRRKINARNLNDMDPKNLKKANMRHPSICVFN